MFYLYWRTSDYSVEVIDPKWRGIADFSQEFYPLSESRYNRLDPYMFHEDDKITINSCLFTFAVLNCNFIIQFSMWVQTRNVRKCFPLKEEYKKSPHTHPYTSAIVRTIIDIIHPPVPNQDPRHQN